MKKFLSICLVALCSVSAMYAQTADSRTNVPYTTNVSVEAKSNDGFYHFVEWKIENGTTPLVTVAKDGSTQSAYGASVSTTVDGTSGVETSTLTLSPIGCDLVNAATSGTVTFEAFFDIDEYTITGTTEGGGSVEFNDNGTSTGTTTGNTAVTLTATSDNCSEFHHWEDENGPIAGATNSTYTVEPQATWVHGSTHTYKAVFVPKTVTITVTTAGNGTVRIVTPDANN